MFLFAACSSTDSKRNNLFYAETVDTSTFVEYCVIYGKLDSSSITIVSKKDYPNACSFEIKENSFYKLSLNKIDTGVTASLLHIFSHNPANVVIEDSRGVEYYRNNKIVGNLYSCSDIKGFCIINPSIFHYP
jgi:hypothetical protein